MMSIFRVLGLLVVVLAVACGVVLIVPMWASSGAVTSVAASPQTTVTATKLMAAWMVNATGYQNPNFPAPVHVQAVETATVNGTPYVRVRTNGIADYRTTMTGQLITELNGRPRASTDFRTGQTTAQVGQGVRFG